MTGTRRSWAGLGFVTPFLIVFALTFVAPIVFSIYLSLYRTKLIGGTSFVGAENYTDAFTDPHFWSAFERVAVFLVVQVPIMLLLALAVALAIDSGRLYGAAMFRLSIFLPYAVPAVVAALMWGFMYGPQFGLVASLNDQGLHLPDPLSPGLILTSIGNIVTWEYVGYNMLIFYAALRVIPGDLYEAAAVDGASQWRMVWAIKLPAIRGALVVATIFSIIGSFQLFNEPSILRPTLAINAITTDFTPNLYAYYLSFSGQEYNYAATVAIIMGVFTMIVAYLVQLRGMRQLGGRR